MQWIEKCIVIMKPGSIVRWQHLLHFLIKMVDFMQKSFKHQGTTEKLRNSRTGRLKKKKNQQQPNICFKSFSVHIMSSKLASYYGASHKWNNLEKLVKLDMLIPFNQLKSHVGHWAVWTHVFSLNVPYVDVFFWFCFLCFCFHWLICIVIMAFL